MLNEQEAAIVSFTPAALDKLVEVMAEQDATDSYLRISACGTLLKAVLSTPSGLKTSRLTTTPLWRTVWSRRSLMNRAFR